MISYQDFQRMDRWVQRTRRQTYRDMQRLRRQRLAEARRGAYHETPVVAALGLLHVLHAWFSTVVMPQFRAAGQFISASARPAARLMPSADAHHR